MSFVYCLYTTSKSARALQIKLIRGARKTKLSHMKRRRNDRSAPTSEPAHRLCLNEGQGRPAPLFPADVTIRGAPRFAPDVTHLRFRIHRPQGPHATCLVTRRANNTLRHRIKRTPVRALSHTAPAAPPCSGRSKPSSPRASATGAASTSSPHLSPSTPRPTPPHPINHAITGQDADDDFLVEEVLDSPTSTSSPAEDVLLVLYSLKPSKNSLAQIWNGKSSRHRLAQAPGQGRQEQEWRRGVVDVVAAETGEWRRRRSEAATDDGEVRLDPRFNGSRPNLPLYCLGSVRLDPFSNFRSGPCSREVRTALPGIL
jgi:hypothetical protein